MERLGSGLACSSSGQLVSRTLITLCSHDDNAETRAFNAAPGHLRIASASPYRRHGTTLIRRLLDGIDQAVQLEGGVEIRQTVVTALAHRRSTNPIHLSA